MAFMTADWNGTESLPIEDFHHVEFYVGNAKQAAHFYRSAFGFEAFAYSGPETGRRDAVSYVLKQNHIFIVLTTALSSRHPVAEWQQKHGDGVKDIAFQVTDVRACFEKALKLGAKEAFAPRELKDEKGSVWIAGIQTYGDTIHTFVNRQNYKGCWLPGFREHKLPSLNRPSAGLKFIDHIVGNVELGKMDHWTEYYKNIFGFTHFIRFDETDISTKFSALKSNVVRNKNWHVKMPLNEPAKGLKKSQIEEFLDFYEGPGVQHIALATENIVETISSLRANGVEFLDAPDSYYEELSGRVGQIAEDVKQLKNLGILVDRDEEGYLLQLFTKPIEDRPTFFFEIIQRKGALGFGQGNFQALFESIEKEQAKRGNL